MGDGEQTSAAGVPNTPAPNGEDEKGEQQKKPEGGEASPAAPKKWKLRARDKEVEADEEQLVRYAHKAFGAEQHVREANRRLEAAQPVLRLQAALKAGDTKQARALLRELGGDGWGKAAEEELWEALQREKQYEGVSPEVAEARRERDAVAKQLREREAADEKVREAQEAEQRRAFDSAMEREVGGLVLEAMKGIGASEGLRPMLTRMAAPYILEALELGTPLTSEELGKLFSEDMRETFRHFAGNLEGAKLSEWLGGDVGKRLTASMDGEALVQWLGEDAANKIRRRDLAILRGEAQPQQPKTPAPKPNEPSKMDARLGRWGIIDEQFK